MKTRDVLSTLKQELASIQPPVGKLFSTLRASAKPEETITDFKFNDPSAGNILKAFILRPADSRISRGTTGRTGFSMRMRNIAIAGLITVREDISADAILEDAFDAIIERLVGVSRLETESQGDSFHVGEMTLSAPAVGLVSNHKVLMQELVTVVQDRILGG